jgi:DNA-binding response OmpR family regulator
MQKTILVVEDDVDMGAWVELHLSNAGFWVMRAANGLQAAALCLQHRPDLIVSDLHMPHTTGFEMLRLLKAEPALRDIPVIFLTIDEGRREIGGSLGAVAYFTKPVKPEALLAAVRLHLS